MSIETTVRIKNEEKSLKRDFQDYIKDRTFVASPHDPILRSYVDQTLQEFNAEADNISVRIDINGW